MFNKTNFPLHLVLAILFATSIIVRIIINYLYANESEYAVLPTTTDWVYLILATAIWVSEKNKALYIYIIFTTIFIIFITTNQTLAFLDKEQSIHKIIDAITIPFCLFAYMYMSLLDPWKILYRYQRKNITNRPA